MAQKKEDQADAPALVVKVPCAVIKDNDGRQVTLYEGAAVESDRFDKDHLKLLKDEGAVGAPDKE